MNTRSLQHVLGKKTGRKVLQFKDLCNIKNKVLIIFNSLWMLVLRAWGRGNRDKVKLYLQVYSLYIFSCGTSLVPRGQHITSYLYVHKLSFFL